MAWILFSFNSKCWWQQQYKCDWLCTKNQDESREVKYTYGYKTGGDFSINRGGLTGNITKESNYSETISYQQPSYRTLLDQSTSHKGVGWKVEAHLINNMGHDHTRQLTNDSDNRTKSEIFL